MLLRQQVSFVVSLIFRLTEWFEFVCLSEIEQATAVQEKHDVVVPLCQVLNERFCAVDLI